jgi:HAD superfamily hydrolase (TIGR01509 family)
MLKGVILDMDGVIADTHPLHIRAWIRLFSSLGKPLAEDNLAFILDGHRREAILRHYLGDLPPDKLSEYGDAKDKLFREDVDQLQPIPGVIEFLIELEKLGLATAVATSARRHRATCVLERLGILHRFAAMVCADDLAEDKPEPHIFRLAGLRLGIDAADLLVAEDAVSGVRAAKAAGMRCLGVARNGHEQMLLNAGADKVIPDFLAVSIGDLDTLFTA